MSVNDVSLDGFLGNRLTIAQPRRGFRAGHDSVLLAASVPAQGNETALELGSGVGVASLCLAARVAGCRITGYDIDPALVAIANENAARNGMAERLTFVCRDVRETLSGTLFDHVFLNPPFHPVTGPASPDATRARAMRDDEDALASWTQIALSQMRPSGSVHVILRADRVESWRRGLSCDGVLLPLAPREGEPPKRALARLRPSEKPSWRVLPPFVLHNADGSPTVAAEAVLRHGAALDLA